MDAFRYTSPAQEVIFGAGSLVEIGALAERHGWHRLILCAARSLRRNGQTARLEAMLGSRLAATFEEIQPHVPAAQVAAVLALARDRHADVLIGLGGGSAIGLAKAVGFAPAQTSGAAGEQPPDANEARQAALPVIAIPTTYAGSEMTAVYGVTEAAVDGARKVTVADPRIAPRVVLYDPDLTLDLAPEMTASTGINALAHCVEALYSVTRHPLSTAAACAGVRHIARALPRCYAVGADRNARAEMLAGAHLAGSALATVSMGLHHGICHVLGGTAGVAHGVANAIMLPHVMRFNLDATAPHLALVAQAAGVALDDQPPEQAALAAIGYVDDLIARLALPRRLRDVGVEADSLASLAEIAASGRTVRYNPKPASAADIEALLRAAW